MSEYEFLPGDKVLIKGREDSGIWTIFREADLSPGHFRLTQRGKEMTTVDRASLIRVRLRTPYDNVEPTVGSLKPAEWVAAIVVRNAEIEELKKALAIKDTKIEALQKKIKDMEKACWETVDNLRQFGNGSI